MAAWFAQLKAKPDPILRESAAAVSLAVRETRS